MKAGINKSGKNGENISRQILFLFSNFQKPPYPYSSTPNYEIFFKCLKRAKIITKEEYKT